MPEAADRPLGGRHLLTCARSPAPATDPQRPRRSDSPPGWRGFASSRCRRSIPPPAGRSGAARRDRRRATRQAVAEAVRDDPGRAGRASSCSPARSASTSPAAHSPASLFGALREAFSSCFCFCVGTPEAAFIGASPELLVRRSGAVAATVALAGSARRSADPAVDDHLGEQLLHSSQGPLRARDRRPADRAAARPRSRSGSSVPPSRS